MAEPTFSEDRPQGPFTYQNLAGQDTAQTRAMSQMREEFATLLEDIELLMHPSRYRSLAVTALEEASLWAQRGLALDGTPEPKGELNAV